MHTASRQADHYEYKLIHEERGIVDSASSPVGIEKRITSRTGLLRFEHCILVDVFHLFHLVPDMCRRMLCKTNISECELVFGAMKHS